MSQRHTELRIKTPEGITFAFALAGPITRFLAWMIDLMIISALTSVVRLTLILAGIITPDLGTAVAVFAFFALPIAYGIGTEWFLRGQTIGKRLLKLRVIDERGLKLGFNQIVLRNLLRAVDALPACYLVGGLACLINRRAQRLGDFAASTIVVRHAPRPEPDLDQLALGPFNSLRAYPHLEARLRQLVSPAEARLALGALMRRDAFDGPARVALFRELAAHFKSRVAFPPEAVEAITDEQYVRNVADVLFRARKPKADSDNAGGAGTNRGPGSSSSAGTAVAAV